MASPLALILVPALLQSESSFYSGPDRLELPTEPNLALLAEEVDDLETWRSFGFIGGALGSEAAVEYDVSQDDERLRATFRYEGILEGYMLEATVDEDGARCSVWEQTDSVGVDHSTTDVGGMALLVTDGQRVFLEIEAHATVTRRLLTYLARIELGDDALELTQALLSRRDELAPSPFVRFVEHRWPMHGDSVIGSEWGEADVSTSRGYVDARGRRQGVWSCIDPWGDKTLDTTWVDGIPHGPVFEWSGGALRSFRMHERGAATGSAYEWHRSGQFRRLDGFPTALGRSSEVWLFPDGRKHAESLFEGTGGRSGREVGTGQRTTRWNRDGQVVAEDQRGFPFWKPPYPKLEPAKPRPIDEDALYRVRALTLHLRARWPD